MTQNARAVLKQWANASVNRQIFSAAFLVGIITIGVKVVAMLRELMVAWQFGTSDAIDAYLIALAIPNFIIVVVVGAFNSAFIPAYIRAREDRGSTAAQKLLSSATVGGVILLLIIMLVAVVMVPYLLPVLASGFSETKQLLTLQLFYSLTPWVVLSAVMQIWAATLNADEKFLIVAITPVLTPFLTLLLLLTLSNSLGVYTLVYGIVLGTALEAFTLGMALHRRGISIKPGWSGFDADMRTVTGQMLPMIAGGLFINGNQIIDQAVAASLGVSGGVASLNFGIRLVVVFTSILSIALSTAVIPYYSKLAAMRDWAKLRATFIRTVIPSIVITVLIAGLVIAFSTPIVKVFLQRGAFTETDTQLVSQIQALAAIQIPFYVASILGIRLISALQHNKVLFFISAVNFTINIVANIFFARIFGIAGIALSTSVVYFFACLMMYIYIFKYAGNRYSADPSWNS